MPSARARLLGLSGLLFGCSSLHPTFEQRIDSGNGWHLFLAARYGCDTVMTRAAQALAQPAPPPPAAPAPSPARGSSGSRRVLTAGIEPPVPESHATRFLGATPCQLAGQMPTEIRGFKIEDGLREEWLRAGVLMYRFEGPHPTQLRVVRVGIP